MEQVIIVGTEYYEEYLRLLKSDKKGITTLHITNRVCKEFRFNYDKTFRSSD